MSYLGAIEAGGTKMICALGREDGSVLESVSIPTTEPARCMPQILEFFQGRGIDALGVGCFGLLDLDRNSQTYGYITTTPKLRWRNYPIMRCLQDALGVPVGIDTDVNAAALAEATWGCSRGLGCSIYITVGTGIGVGIIVDGKPHHGMIHPECGHIPVNRRSDDPMVRGVCPYHGSCLEGLACGPAIESRWGRSPGRAGRLRGRVGAGGLLSGAGAVQLYLHHLPRAHRARRRRDEPAAAAAADTRRGEPPARWLHKGQGTERPGQLHRVQLARRQAGHKWAACAWRRTPWRRLQHGS